MLQQGSSSGNGSGNGRMNQKDILSCIQFFVYSCVAAILPLRVR